MRWDCSWEFKDAINAGRVRRIVSYATKTHYGDVNLTRMYLISTSPTTQDPDVVFAKHNGSSGYGTPELNLHLSTNNNSTRYGKRR